jgi:hypothetical protein
VHSTSSNSSAVPAFPFWLCGGLPAAATLAHLAILVELSSAHETAHATAVPTLRAPSLAPLMLRAHHAAAASGEFCSSSGSNNSSSGITLQYKLHAWCKHCLSRRWQRYSLDTLVLHEIVIIPYCSNCRSFACKELRQ